MLVMLSLNLHVLLEYVQIVQIYLLRFVHVSVSFCRSNIYMNKVLQVSTALLAKNQQGGVKGAWC